MKKHIKGWPMEQTTAQEVGVLRQKVNDLEKKIKMLEEQNAKNKQR